MLRSAAETKHDTELLAVYRRVHEVAPHPGGHHRGLRHLFAEHLPPLPA